ncbi:MAG: hypothetical protein RL653_2637 [Pseudomonadota bacterium]
MTGRWRTAVLWGVLAAGIAGATTVRKGSLREIAEGADRVVRARVAKTETRLGPGGDVRRMTTWSRLEVLEEWKGQGPAAIDLLQLGGRHGEWAARLVDDAELVAGEEAVFLLRCRDPRFPERCTLYGLKDARLRARGALLAVEPLGGGVTWREAAALREELVPGRGGR